MNKINKKTNKRAGITESKIVQIILVLVAFLVIAFLIYPLIKDKISDLWDYTFGWLR